MALKISISGVRGTIPDSLTPELCLDFAKAFGTYTNGGTIVIGIDPRPSSEYIKGILYAGLLSAGCKVIDIGIAPTPTVGIMTKLLRADGGIVVTASHNPLPWNGIKFMTPEGLFLNEKKAAKLIDLYEKKKFRVAVPQTVESNDQAIALHIKKVLKVVDVNLIRKKKFRVALDGCNGAGSIALVELLKKLGCVVYPINCNVLLPFPHNPEPVPENITELIGYVQAKKADVGFVVDADADRLAIVADGGFAIGEELTLALAAASILEAAPNAKARKHTIVTNLSTSRVVDDVAKSHGAKVVRTKIGEIHVVEEIIRQEAIIGGEGNGGVIFPQVGYNRDSLAGIALILHYMAKSGQPLSKLAKSLPQYVMIKSKVDCNSQFEVTEWLEKVKKSFAGEEMVIKDGIKVVFPDAWVHVRASNTEPIIRIMAEAPTREAAEELIKRITG
ncbi:MAG: phosphoglucosamine mutase [Candidatus Margulisiibacteriota bacterium]|jgi:phosphomannomutase